MALSPAYRRSRRLNCVGRTKRTFAQRAADAPCAHSVLRIEPVGGTEALWGRLERQELDHVMIEKIPARRPLLQFAFDEAVDARREPGGFLVAAGPRLVALVGEIPSVIFDLEGLERSRRHYDRLRGDDIRLPPPLDAAISRPDHRFRFKEAVPHLAYLEWKPQRRPERPGCERHRFPGLDFEQIVVACVCSRARRAAARFIYDLVCVNHDDDHRGVALLAGPHVEIPENGGVANLRVGPVGGRARL